ncbi:MAG: hypothetical protein D6824_07295 [Planctomycetota bacterium]|nr:MAG: hypothetical protein D6824_07295 [Planctomycetota bacterium]
MRARITRISGIVGSLGLVGVSAYALPRVGQARPALQPAAEQATVQTVADTSAPPKALENCTILWLKYLLCIDTAENPEVDCIKPDCFAPPTDLHIRQAEAPVPPAAAS